jgi:hypothetical protein
MEVIFAKEALSMWTPWTTRSENVPFKSTQKGVGNGEAKVAAELGATMMGQNKSFDLLLERDGETKEIEVKELDKGTFNTGQKGRQALVRIREKISSLCETNTQAEAEKSVPKNPKLANLNPDELSVGSLEQLAARCAELNQVLTAAMRDAPPPPPFVHPVTGAHFEMDLFKWSEVYRAVGCPLSTEMSTLATLNHHYVREPGALSSDLKGLVNMFERTNMVIVDEKKGYAAVDNTKIVFERITRGVPRFRILGV